MTTTLQSQTLVRRLIWEEGRAPDPSMLEREWLVTNGLGGFASNTLAGLGTRRHHGLLIAALPSPWGRMLMLHEVSQAIRFSDGRSIPLVSFAANSDITSPAVCPYLREFYLEWGLPVWRYHVEGTILEKRIWLPYRQNTAFVCYRLIDSDKSASIELRPWMHFRRHETMGLNAPLADYGVSVRGGQVQIDGDGGLALRLRLVAPRFELVLDGGSSRELFFRLEAARGYSAIDRVWSPGVFRAPISPGQQVILAASTDPWASFAAANPQATLQGEILRRQRLLTQAHVMAQHDMGRDLVVAADQFIVTPAARSEDIARVIAEGDEARTVIAGYHWFTDWGRDTMISLEGLTLSTGRHAEAGYILRTFAHYVRDGLIPNLFPEGENKGLYHTADATLWFFHALDRYLQTTQDWETLERLLPTLMQIVQAHIRGTRFGIGVDPEDGLLTQGEKGYQLTWMDAKVDDWVVTPRRGKAVEINALWYNALRLLQNWIEMSSQAHMADEVRAAADQTRESFNRRFWYEPGGYLFDVIDGEQGDDAAFRPNQIFSISLPHPVLDQGHWTQVVDQVAERLLTPVGLRTLAPGHSDYKARYDGDLRSRDAAYHQGTVWAWLIGPFIDAWLKAHPDRRDEAKSFLGGFESHLNEACVGTISEIFDGEAPYYPRGCAAQAWSIAEVLRTWIGLHDVPEPE